MSHTCTRSCAHACTEKEADSGAGASLSTHTQARSLWQNLIPFLTTKQPRASVIVNSKVWGACCYSVACSSTGRATLSLSCRQESKYPAVGGLEASFCCASVATRAHKRARTQSHRCARVLTQSAQTCESFGTKSTIVNFSPQQSHSHALSFCFSLSRTPARAATAPAILVQVSPTNCSAAAVRYFKNNFYMKWINI